MKSFLKPMLLAAAGLVLGATAAPAAPWADLTRGDLLLGVQASGGTGSTTNVFFNLGPAHALRDNPNPAGVIVNLDAELTAAFGAGWATRSDLYFGVFANRSKNPPSGLGSLPPENGDVSRTIYASRGTAVAGASIPWTGFTTNGLGLGANNHQGQVDGDLPALNNTGENPVIANVNQVATITQASHPVPWANSWSKWNPFLGGGAAGPAYGIFTGGIQARFGEPPAILGDPDPGVALPKLLDVFRILGTTGNGTYVTTVELADTGDVTIAAAGAPATYVQVNGTAVNGSILGAAGGVLYAQGSTAKLTAIPAAGFKFDGWSGDVTGMQNPIDVVMNSSKNVTATFVPLPVYTLTLAPSSGGTITGLAAGGQYTEGANAALTAVPDAGLVFAGWTGDAAGTQNPISINMTGDKSVGALFVGSLEEAELLALPSRFNVGDAIDIDLSFITVGAGQTMVVSGLPRGVTFNAATQRVQGTIQGFVGNNGVTIQVRQGRAVVKSFPFDLAVDPYLFQGNFIALIEDGTSQPIGSVRVAVTGPGAFSATLELLNQRRRATRGTFAQSGAAQQTVNITFPPSGGAPAANVSVNLDTASDLVTGNLDANTLRGMRLASNSRFPGGTIRANIALVPDVAGDRVNVPGGVGFLAGTINNRGRVALRGFTGDGQAARLGGELSQTNQLLVWVTPYRNKASYLGGIVDLGDLGQPGRAESDDSADPGLQWLKVPDPGERAYRPGFPAQALTGATSRWYPMGNAEALAQSLGLDFRRVNAGYIAPVAATLPSRFSLRDNASLITIAPSTAVPWRGSANRTSGAVNGTLRNLPSGNGTLRGVLLQDDSFGTTIGTGFIQVPDPLVARTFQTFGVELSQ